MVDCAWFLRLWDLAEEKRFEIVRRAYEKKPDDLATKAQFAKLLILGPKAGGPPDRAAEGVALAEACTQQGSNAGQFALACAKRAGLGTPKDLALGNHLLRSSAEAGYLEAILDLGTSILSAEPAVSNADEAEEWLRIAARRGAPHALYRYATSLEKPRTGQVVPHEKVATLLYDAAKYGSGKAEERLKAVRKDPSAPPVLRRAAGLFILWQGALGYDGIFPAQLKITARELEATYPDDPEMLLALGRLYKSGENQMRDFKKAYSLLSKAAALGEDDALAERAKMQAEGLGVPADPAAALVAWRELEKRNNARALGILGYYSYWGSLKADGLKKDPHAAYAYSRLAAAGGDFFAQSNITFCFAHGIGTAKNYKLAVLYSHAAAYRGNRKAKQELPQLLTAAFD